MRKINKDYASTLIRLIDKAIQEENQMWEQGKSHPFIIGTLVGYLKGIKTDLYISSGLYENKDNKQDND